MTSARNICMKALLILLAAFGGHPAMAQSWNDVMEWYNAGNYSAAFEGFKKNADQGDPDAQYFLGKMYLLGEGIPQDYAEAVRWFRLSADQGHPDAQYNLGLMYRDGLDVPQDYLEARRWFRLSADQGESGAQYNLGVLYSRGLDVPRDYAEAARWFRLSADQCNPYGQINLGHLYNNGKGVDKDLAQAYMWFNLAAALSASEDHPLREEAVRFREEVKCRLTRDEIDRSQQLAAERHESRCEMRLCNDSDGKKYWGRGVSCVPSRVGYALFPFAWVRCLEGFNGCPTKDRETHPLKINSPENNPFKFYEPLSDADVSNPVQLQRCRAQTEILHRSSTP